MSEDNKDNPPKNNFSVSCIPKESLFSEQIEKFDERQTEGGILDLTKLRPGENIKVDFYPDEKTLENYPPIYIQTLKPATEGKSYYEAIAAGGLLEWNFNNKRIIIEGSKFSRYNSSIMVNSIAATQILKIRAYDNEMAENQKSGKAKINTPLGSKYIKGFGYILKKDPTFLDNFIGWEILYSPKVADFKVEKPLVD